MVSFWLGGVTVGISLLIGEAFLGRVPDIVYHAARVRPIPVAAIFIVGLLSWPISIPYAYWFLRRKQKEENEIQTRRVGCMAVGKFGAICDGPWGHDWPHSFEFLDELAESYREKELEYRRSGEFDVANYYREIADAAEKGLTPLYVGLFTHEP